ncbi:acyltransferase [Brevundimonas guildfordensis]|uniref:acyltransferase n=1 Tax=Brevundimonas guildfordensis TaxID=2762241 RepID=UPI00384E36B5
MAIGDHVWIGAGARILKNARIGKGSIVAAVSLVAGKDYPPCSLIAGSPAVVKRSGTSWTRSSIGVGWESTKAKFGLTE